MPPGASLPLRPSLFLTASTRWRSDGALASIARRRRARAESQERPGRPAWRRDPAAPLERWSGALSARPSFPRLNQRAAPSSPVEDGVRSSRREKFLGGRAKVGAPISWRRGVASRVCAEWGRGLVSRRGLGETALPRHPGVAFRSLTRCNPSCGRVTYP